ncbi:MAG: hypothetical protein RR365_10825 [Bacteroides sp.]
MDFSSEINSIKNSLDKLQGGLAAQALQKPRSSSISISKESIALERIKISKAFRDSIPSSEKISKCYSYYSNFGNFDRDIILDEDRLLIDGYVAYLVAKMLGIKFVKVLRIVSTDMSVDCAVNNAPTQRDEKNE